MSEMDWNPLIRMCLLLLLQIAQLSIQPSHVAAADLSASVQHRSPVDLVLTTDESWLVTINETSHSLSLIDREGSRVVYELNCGAHPTAIERCLDDRHVIVSCSYSGEVQILKIHDRRLQLQARIETGFEPTGLAVSADGQRAWVGLQATGEVAELDLRTHQVLRRISVGPWPRSLAVSPDGTRLAVGCSGAGTIVVLDTATAEVLYEEKLIGGINIGHLCCSADSREVYFPWMVYRSNPINVGNIQKGWVLASRIARVRLDGPAYREAISLDVPRKAVADPHGLAISKDEQRLVVSASGTHELLVYRRPDLPFVGIGGPGDLIDRKLLIDRDLFYRIDVGGRPLGLEISRDQKQCMWPTISKTKCRWLISNSNSSFKKSNWGRLPN